MRLRLSLSKKAFLFFFLFEACMVAIFGILLLLLHQADAESLREERAKRVIGETQQLMYTFVQAGQFVADYCKTRDKAYLDRYDKVADEIPRKCQWLKEQFQDSPGEYAVFERVDQTTNEMLETFNNTRKAVENLPTLEALPIVLKARERVQPKIPELEQQVIQLVEKQRAIVEDEGPRLARQRREQYKVFVQLGFVVATLLSVLALVVFLKGVLARLLVMEDNAQRLANDKPLNERIAGGDEIAHLDGVFHDMAAALKEAQEAERAFLAKIQQSEARIRGIIESLNASLIVIDHAGRIDFVNAATGQMFAYQTGDLIGASLVKLLPARGSSADEHIDSIIKRSLGHIVELTAARLGGQEFPVEVSLSACDFAEGPRLVANILDVSERHEIQKMRQAFVSMVSHDLRTPLTSVQGFLELLEMGALGEVSEKAREHAGRANNSVGRLIKLINDLLDLEKMESGTIKLAPDAMNVGRLIDESLESVRVFAEKYDVSLVARSADVEVTADFDRLVQVLVNLLSNAIKFSAPQGTVEVAVEATADWVEVRVKDQGRGVPAKFRDVIFERFQQVEESDNKKKGGTGLGLPICKAIVEQHGGTIGVDSEEGAGSQFWFRLPRQGAVVSDTVASTR